MDVEKIRKRRKKIGGISLTAICVLFSYVIISVFSPASEVAAQVNCDFEEDANIKLLIDNIEQGRSGYLANSLIIESIGSNVAVDVQNNNVNQTITYTDGSVYIGGIVNGQRSGMGTLTYIDGSSYVGIWENDMMQGNGKYTFADGSFMEGLFAGNTFVNGTYLFVKEAGTFCVVVANSQLTSQVAVSLKSGDAYNGTLINGMFNGVCSVTYNDGDVYQGNIVNNLKHGTGTYIWKEGAYYIGEWANDMMQGSGTYYYAGANGPKITGIFVANKPDGWCTYYQTENVKYSTYWSNGSLINM